MATAAVSRYDDGAAYAKEFRSRSVQELDLSDFGLVLTATRAIRSEVIRRDPRLRDRTFTVREAAALAAAPLQRDEAAILLASGPAPILAARRGATALPRIPRRMPWSRPANPLDLPDTHNDRRRHAAGVELAVATGVELGARLQAWHDSAPDAAPS